MRFERYWNAIQPRVCVRCIDGDGWGNCHIGFGRDCAVKLYLPLIVSAVRRVTSDRIEDYVSELRGIVCAQCKFELPSGRCKMREAIECALDRYFPLIVEAIEETPEPA